MRRWVRHIYPLVVSIPFLVFSAIGVFPSFHGIVCMLLSWGIFFFVLGVSIKRR